MRKCITVTEEDVKLLQQYKQKLGIRTDSGVISYLLRETYEKEKQLAVLIREELEQNYIQKERIKWATQTAEQNSIVLLDAMNTLLWMLNAKENISVEHAAHPVVKQSKDAIKEKIAYFKQKSDDRKAKADGKSNEKS